MPYIDMARKSFANLCVCVWITNWNEVYENDICRGYLEFSVSTSMLCVFSGLPTYSIGWNNLSLWLESIPWKLWRCPRARTFDVFTLMEFIGKPVIKMQPSCHSPSTNSLSLSLYQFLSCCSLDLNGILSNQRFLNSVLLFHFASASLPVCMHCFILVII